MLCQICGFDIECARRVSLLQRDINAANPGVIHTNVGDYVSAFVGNRDIHWLPISLAFFSAALITRRASSRFTADMDSSLRCFISCAVAPHTETPAADFGADRPCL